MNPTHQIEQLVKMVDSTNQTEARKLISELIKKTENRYKDAARELNDARLAALNMMEDSMLAKKQLELTQFSIDHSADSVFWIRPDATFSYVNEAACRQLGYSQDELLHMAVKDIDPDFPAEVWPAHWQQLKKEGGLVFESRHKTKEGQIFPVLIHASFISFDDQEYVCAFAHDITTRKQTERQLAESRKNLEITLYSIGDAVISTDTAGQIILMNPMAEKLTGWTKAEAVGKPLQEVFKIVNEQTLKPVESPFAKVIASGRIVKLANHTLLITKDGREIPIADSGAPICDDAGNITGVVLVFRDQTGERASRRYLEESEARYRLLFDNMTTGFALHEMLYDTQGNPVDYRYIQINPAFEKLTGLQAQRTLGHTVKELLPNIEDVWIENFGRVATTGEPAEFENYVHAMDKFFDVRAFCPSPGQFAVVFSDITARKKIEQELELSRQFLRTIIDTIPVRVFWKDRNSTYLGCNLAFARDAGFDSPEKLIGKTDFDMGWTTEESEAFRADDRTVILSGKAKLHFEEPQTHPDKTLHWLETNKLPLRDAQNNCVGVIGTYEDITARKLTEKALQFEQRLFREFMDTIPAAISFKDLEGRFIRANPVALSGRREDEIVGKTDFDFAPEDAAKRFREHELQVLETKQVIQSEEHAYDNWAFATKAPWYDENGKLAGTYGISWDITERKLAEKNILFERNLFTSFMETIPANVYFKDLQSRFVRINQKFADFFAKPREELIGKTDMDLFPEDQARKKLADEQQVMQTGQPIQLEELSGTTWHMTTKAPRYDENGELAGTFGISWDITERKKAENELRESQEYLSSMWSLMDIGILLVDADSFKILDVNPALLKISGYKKEDLTGRVCHRLVCPAEEGKCPVGNLGLIIDRSERKLIHADGHEIDVEKSVKAVTLNGRKVYLETILDITARKEAEKELRRLSTAIEQSPETVLITNPKGLIQYVNPAFETITGYSAQEAVGKTPRILRSGRHDRAFYSHLWKTIQSGEVWSGRFINKRKTGEVYTEEASISPVRDPEGNLIGYVANKRDITEELVKEEQLRQNQKMQAVGQLAGGIAHDFNNILQAILGFSEILLMRIKKESMEYHNITEIQKAALRASDLTRQLLAFSRKQPVQKQQLDINASISDSKTLLKMLAGERIECVFDLEPVLSPVLIDHGQITQIIMNLAVNARDAMPNGGQLTLSTRNATFDPNEPSASPNARSGRFSCISVADSGSGMNQEVKAHLFEPFFTTKGIGSGTGLGLSVVYGIVQQNDGWIHVDSEEGKGTVFNIYLPACETSSIASSNLF